MASPPSIQRFYSDDYKDAPTWFKSTFLNTLNLFVFPVYNAINKNLTVTDNLNQGYSTISLTGSATATNNTASFIESDSRRSDGGGCGECANHGDCNADVPDDSDSSFLDV